MKTAFRQFRESYFNFSKAERNAVFVFTGLIIILIILPFLWPLFISNKTDNTQIKLQLAALVRHNDSLSQNMQSNYRQAHTSAKNNRHTEVFLFDPNTAGEDDLKRLGFKPWIAERIIKYRKVVGNFHAASDLKKVYGIDTALVNALLPVMQFPEYASGPFTEKPQAKQTITVSQKPTIIDLNTADTTALMSLPGIGRVFARRIIHYRTILGGFYKTEQLLEVYGFDQARYDLVKGKVVAGSGIRMIAINTVTLEGLRHPYITPIQAKAIISYRDQHGAFLGREDLLKVKILTPDIIDKFIVYLSF